MTDEIIRKAVADYFAAIRAIDVDAWVSTFDENGVSYDPVGAPPLEGFRGPEQLRAFFLGISGAFETVSLTEEAIFTGGNGAAVKWVGKGVGRNGKAVAFEGIDFFEINENGKIAKLSGFWNPGPVMAVLMS